MSSTKISLIFFAVTSFGITAKSITLNELDISKIPSLEKVLEPDLKSDFQILKMPSSGDEAVPLTFKNGFCNVIINTDDGIKKGWLPYYCTSYYSCGN